MKYSFKPFTNNIIFFDTEFSSLDPYKGEILSVGMITLDGKELYLELEYNGGFDTWVKKNIVPTLKGKKISREEAVKQITKFVGKKKPYLMSYVNQYDIIYMYKLFGKEKKPFFWLPLDFASILYGLSINPEGYYPKDKDNFFKIINVDKKKFNHSHNAIEDARLLREVYLKMTQTKTKGSSFDEKRY